MDYELAKELKCAGFPQGTGRYFLEEGTGAYGSAKEVEWMLSALDAKDTPQHSFAYIPTLEELIEACGDEFAGVGRPTAQRDAWQARAIGLDQYANGGTPTEAVAWLWLSLSLRPPSQ